MKKNFSFENSELPINRHIDCIKSEVKKYIARERRKQLPEGFDLWSFDCKFGDSESLADTVFANEIRGLIDQSVKSDKKTCYVEILSRPDKFKKKRTKMTQD